MAPPRSKALLTVLLSVGVFLGFSSGLNAAPGATGLRLTPQSSARYQCGPTTLASVLAYHDHLVPEATIAAAIYSPTARGVLLTDLAWYARELGFETTLRTGTPADLQAALAAGQPPIVLLDVGLLGTQQPHITALTAWRDDGVHTLSTRANGKRVSLKTFERQWQRAGNLFLILTPRS